MRSHRQAGEGRSGAKVWSAKLARNKLKFWGWREKAIKWQLTMVPLGLRIKWLPYRMVYVSCVHQYENRFRVCAMPL